MCVCVCVCVYVCIYNENSSLDVVVSVILYVCTAWTITKHIEKKHTEAK